MKERITEDLKSAMKAQDKFKLTVLRAIKGAIQLEEIKNKSELSTEEFALVISKQIKMRKESIVDFEKGNRQDLIDITNKEIEILNLYLPKQLDEKEISVIIDKAIDVIKPTSSSDIGKVMGMVAKEVKGKADLSLVNKMVKEKLNS